MARVSPKANNLVCEVVSKHLLHHETAMRDGSKRKKVSELDMKLSPWKKAAPHCSTTICVFTVGHINKQTLNQIFYLNDMSF